MDTAGTAERAVDLIVPCNLGPLLGAFSCLRHQTDAQSNRLGRFCLMCMSRFGTERLMAEPFNCRCSSKHSIKNDGQAT